MSVRTLSMSAAYGQSMDLYGNHQQNPNTLYSMYESTDETFYQASNTDTMQEGSSCRPFECSASEFNSTFRVLTSMPAVAQMNNMNQGAGSFVDIQHSSNDDKYILQKIQPPKAGTFKQLLQSKPPKKPCRYASIESNCIEKEHVTSEIRHSDNNEEPDTSNSDPCNDVGEMFMIPVHHAFPKRRSLVPTSRVSSVSSITYADSEYDWDLDYELPIEVLSGRLMFSTDNRFSSDKRPAYMNDHTDHPIMSPRLPRRRPTIKFGNSDKVDQDEALEMPKRRSTIMFTYNDSEFYPQEED